MRGGRARGDARDDGAREEALAEVDARVDAAKLAGERIANAAKRQVAALDKALSGRDALVACTEARARWPSATKPGSSRTRSAPWASRSRGPRPRAGPRRSSSAAPCATSSRASSGRTTGSARRFSPAAASGTRTRRRRPPAKKAPPAARPGNDTFDAKTRATYVALAVSRLCAAAGAGEESRAATVAPVLRELLKQPHNAVKHWLAFLERDAEAAAATCAALDLLRDALDEGAERERSAASLGAQRALLRYDARLAAAAVLSAARDNAARAREDTRTRAAAQRMCAAAEAAVADAVKRVEAADNARDNAVQEAAELQRAVAESGTSVEFAHARAACVAVLRSGRGSAAYNKPRAAPARLPARAARGRRGQRPRAARDGVRRGLRRGADGAAAGEGEGRRKRVCVGFFLSVLGAAATARVVLHEVGPHRFFVARRRQRSRLRFVFRAMCGVCTRWIAP